MDDKSLADKAVSIKGKQYVLVSDRILYFNEKYPRGSITTELLSAPEDSRVVVKATIRVQSEGKDELLTINRTFTGHSQAVVGEGMVNKTAALENAETSAVGRALAMMGIGVIDSVASVDEMKKSVVARNEEPFKDNYPRQSNKTAFDDEPLTVVKGHDIVEKEKVEDVEFDSIIWH